MLRLRLCLPTKDSQNALLRVLLFAPSGLPPEQRICEIPANVPPLSLSYRFDEMKTIGVV